MAYVRYGVWLGLLAAACGDSARLEPSEAPDAGVVGTPDEAGAPEDSGAPGPGTELRVALEGYWPLDGDGRDLSGKERSLRIVGDPRFEPGIVGRAMAVAGDGSQYATSTDSAPPLGLGSPSFTVSVWASFTDAVPERTLVAKLDGQRGPGWSLNKLGTSEVQFSAPPDVDVFSRLVALSDRTWHHFVVRRDGSRATLLLDGTLVGEGAVRGGIIPSSTPLLVGKRGGVPGRENPADGRLDELAIWSRALDDSEVRFLWNDGRGSPPIR